MPQEAPQAAIQPRSRLRFTLRTLLLLILAVALGLGYSHTWCRMRDAEREVRIRRDESGVLSIEDRTQFHAIVVDTDEPNTWRWRLFAPKGHRYSWNIACEEIPQKNVPKKPGISGYSNEPYWETDNEVLVTVRLRQIDDETWQLSAQSRIGDSKNQMAGASLEIPDDKLRWMSEISSIEASVLGSRGTDVSDPKGPIVLLRRRICKQQPDGSFQPTSDPMPGFMVWLEEWP
jgi:hypothetical protein